MNISVLHGKGNHLIVDGCSEANLASQKFIKKFLLELVSNVKMKPISKPFVIYYNADKKSESGVTGIIILAESNITIHTYPDKNWFCLDIFSCKEFEIKKTVNYIVDRLKVVNYKKKVIRRGFYGKD